MFFSRLQQLQDVTDTDVIAQVKRSVIADALDNTAESVAVETLVRDDMDQLKFVEARLAWGCERVERALASQKAGSNGLKGHCKKCIYCSDSKKWNMGNRDVWFVQGG